MIGTTSETRELTESELVAVELHLAGLQTCGMLAEYLTRMLHQVRNPPGLEDAIYRAEEAESDRKEMFDENEQSLEELGELKRKYSALLEHVEGCDKCGQ